MRRHVSNSLQSLLLAPADACLGLMIALFIAIGRWTFSRVSSAADDDEGLLLEPRLWVTIAAVIWSFQVLAARRSTVSFRLKTLPAFKVLGWQVPFFIYIMATRIWAPDVDIAWHKAYELALILSFVGVLAAALMACDRNAVTAGIWIGLLGFGVLLAVVGSLSFGGGRLSVLGGGPNVFGRNMVVLILSCAYLYSRGVPGPIMGPVVLVALLLLSLSGSRGALLSGFSAMAVLAYFMRIKWSTKIVTATTLLAVGIIVIEFTTIGQAARETFEERVLQRTIRERYISGRDLIYSDALEMIRREPAFGSGLGGFKAWTGTYPHNLILEIACEGGLVGVMFFLLACYPFVAFVFKHRDKVDPAALGGVALFFVFSQFSGDLFDTRGLFLFAAMALFHGPHMPISLRGRQNFEAMRAQIGVRHPAKDTTGSVAPLSPEQEEE